MRLGISEGNQRISEPASRFARVLLVLSLLPITLAVLLAACGDDDETSGGSDKLNVMTTLPLFADFAREIGGDRVEITSLVPTGADPHTWEPAPSDVQRVAEADIAFANGLDLEPSAIEVMETNLPDNTELVVVGEEVARAGAELVASQEEEGEEHQGEEPSEFEGMNPHLWLGIDNAKEYARVVRDGLSEADVDGADEYDRNYEAFLAELDEVDAYVREKTDPIQGSNRKLITTHDAFSYFADYFGFEVLSFVAESPGQEPSPEDVANLARDIEGEGVPAVFAEPQIEGEGEILEQAANDAGVQVCTLYSDSLDDTVTSYIELMRFNADELARCLGGEV
jgi:manganese/iron transport system substrate-binding protein